MNGPLICMMLVAAGVLLVMTGVVVLQAIGVVALVLALTMPYLIKWRSL